MAENERQGPGMFGPVSTAPREAPGAPVDAHRPAARRPAVVVVDSVAALDRITRRGLAPSVPPGARVELTLVPADRPERATWERSIRHHASACGCQSAAAVLVLVLGSLIAAKTLLGVTVTLPGLPLYASWIVVCAAAVVLVKLVAVHHARRSLGRLRSTIAAAAAAPQAS